MEEFIDYLKSIWRLDEAAVKLSEIVNKVSERDREREGGRVREMREETKIIQDNCSLKQRVRCMYLSLQDSYVSRSGKSKHQLWHELCELISKNPDHVSTDR